MLYPVLHTRDALSHWVKRAPALPRTVLVPSERIAHVLRRELAVDPSTRPMLVGTRFARTNEIARERILRLEASPKEGLEEVLPYAIESLLRGTALENKLAYFSLDHLRRGAGFAKAIAATMGDLSAASVDLDTLLSAAAKATDDVSRKRIRDLIAIIEELKLPLVDRHEVLRRAAKLRAAERGSFFAVLTAIPDESEIAFLGTIPGLDAAILTAAPARPEAADALEGLGARLGGLAAAPVPTLPDNTEISILRRYLLSNPEELADEKRPGSTGSDGTVHLELHAGAGDELNAARDWVAEQIRQGVALERIAVIGSNRDPYLGMIHDRLSTLPWNDDKPLLHVAGGLPATGTSAGRRVIGILDSLDSGLRVQEFARVLPWLSFEAPLGGLQQSHLSPSEANHIVWNCGTLGGSPEARANGSSWKEGMERLINHLSMMAAVEHAPERLQHDVEEARLLLDPIRSALPSIVDLVRLNALAASGASLEKFWPAFSEFYLKRVLAFDPHGIFTALSARIDVIISFSVKGLDAVRVIRDAFNDLRYTVGRFGEPRIFIGTLPDACGIPFEAVRIVGLAEGGVAGSVAEDPLLPDGDRRLLDAPIRLAAQVPLKDLQNFNRLIRHTEASLVLSAPRQTIDGTVREPSSILLEVVAALRRPNAATGRVDADLLRRSALDRDYLAPARSASRANLKIRPSREATKDIEQFVLAQESHTQGPLDGYFSKPPPGAIPKSASGFKTFLECPHRFLFERVLHWQEPQEIPTIHALDSLTYGNLFHAIIEGFFKKSGAAFYDHTGAFDAHLNSCHATADQLFDDLVRFYPLEGEARTRERERLHDDVTHALRHEWSRKAVKIVDIELPFGYSRPVTIDGLDAHGYIDRVDIEAGATVIRDFKTGGEKTRKPGDPAEPALDVQLAFYAMALEAMTKDLKIGPPSAAAYVYVRSRRAPKRAFEGPDFAGLLKSGHEWLALVRKMAEEGAYPRTPNPDDCAYCPFVPVCGPGAAVLSESKLTHAKGAGADFLTLKLP